MDILKSFESLNYSYKQYAISIALLFPISFLSCWKMSFHFQLLEFFQEVVLSLGVDIIMLVANIFFLSIAKYIAIPLKMNLSENNIFNFPANPILLVGIFIPSVFYLTIDRIFTFFDFFKIWAITTAVFYLICIIIRLALLSSEKDKYDARTKNKKQ